MDAIQALPTITPLILGAISVFLLIISIFLAKPWLAGVISNARIERSLNLLKSKGATVLNHVLLANKKGEVIHIDDLIITNTEIFAITTLGYSGEILGSVRSATWTQETRQGSSRFPNPMRHHEITRSVLQGILGERLAVKTISVFTSGHLHGTDTGEVMSAQQFAQSMRESMEEITTGPKQYWASNIIKNVLVSDRRKTKRDHAFVSHQGNVAQLKTARLMIAASAVLMLLAMVIVGLRLAANYNLI